LAGAFAGAFAMMSLSFANRIEFEHYIFKARKHAVLVLDKKVYSF